MSRHKLVKQLDLEDELNDFDGGEDGYDESADTAGRHEVLTLVVLKLFPYKWLMCDV